jgi:hypothetical protein
VGLSALRAAAARDGIDDLFSVFAENQAADVDDAISTGVSALQASVVRLYGIVVILGGWVRVGCARLSPVHS